MALHVVFGAGQIGLPLARRLAAAGQQARLVSRSGSGTGLAGVEVARGDALDAAFCAEAARGAAAVYHCMNPPYQAATWERQLPTLLDNLVAAAGGAGARLVVLDNVYALGRPGGRPLDEERPLAPCSRKGEIRAQVARRLASAVEQGRVRAVVGRASDFFGPGGVQTYFEARFWGRAFQGKSAQLIFDPDTRHTWHYVPDVAAGLAALGQAPEEGLSRCYMLPAAPAETTRQLVGRMAAALGRPLPVSRVPRLVVSLMAVFTPLMRELLEMDYQWDEDFVVDDRRFQARFGLAPTPLDEAARETVAWARGAYGAGPG